MINKLLAYGCSFTFGDSLGVPTVEAWPYKLGQMLNVDVVNNGFSGGSNKLSINRLFSDISQIEYSNILVIFSWTGIQRTTFYNEERKQWVPCLVGHEFSDLEFANLNKLYYKYFYSDYDALFNYYVQILSVQSFLKQRKIKYLFMNSFKEDYIFYDDPTFASMREFIDKSRYVFDFNNNIYDEICIKQNKIASDGFHPSAEGHMIIAQEVHSFYKVCNFYE